MGASRDDPRWQQPTVPAVPNAFEEPAASSDGAPTAAATPSGARFVVGAELGRGGMGRVVAATDTALARQVAIKQSLTDDPTLLARFEREARFTAKLEHASIVPIHDIGHDADGRPFYVMRRLRGEPLADRVKRANGVRGRLALVPDLLAAIDALAFAHAHGVIHRDVKPWNIVLGEFGETVVIDWGLARHIDEPDPEAPDADGDSRQAQGSEQEPPAPDSKLTRGPCGTPGYMAPEQARGERVDARADVYALGATLFHVLAGKTPLGGRSPLSWMTAADTGIEPPLDELPPEVPPELVTIVGKAMANLTDDRYRDAGELAADVRRFLGGQLVAAHRYTTAQRLARFVRRHRVAVAIASLAVVALGVLGVVAIAGVINERDRADAASREATARAEQMVIERASTLATRDPTRAVALLARLPIGSPSWARARDIAAVAVAGGIAHGAASHRGAVTALALSPDGTQLASAGVDGTLRLHDVATGATRTLVALPPGPGHLRAVWTEAGASLTFAGPAGLRVADISRGTTRVLDANAHVSALWSVAAGDRVRYFDPIARTLVEQPLAGTASVLARDVAAVAPTGDRTLVASRDTLQLLDGPRTVWQTPVPAAPLWLALSPAGDRAAAGFARELVEWDTRDGRERARWPLGDVTARRDPVLTRLFYGGDRLYVAIAAGASSSVHELVAGVPSAERLVTASPIVGATQIATGTAIVSEGGALAVIAAIGVQRFVHEHPGTRIVAGEPHSPILAIGTSDGGVLWWDSRRVIPAIRPMPEPASLCAVDGDRVVALAMDALHVIDRAGGVVTLPITPTSMCIPSVVDHHLALALGDATRADLVDLEHGTVEHVRTATRPLVDAEAHAITILDGNTVRDLPGGRLPAVTRWTAPRQVLWLASAGRWIATLLDDGTVARIDRDAPAVTTVRPPFVSDRVVACRDGTIWLIARGALWRWRDGLIFTSELPAAIVDAVPLAAGIAVMLADRSLWHVTAAGAVQRVGPGDRRLTWGTAGLAVTFDATHTLSLVHLQDGETARHPIDAAVRSLAVGNADHTVAVDHVRTFAIYDDPVPDDPASLAAFLGSVTNAELRSDRDSLTWR